MTKSSSKEPNARIVKKIGEAFQYFYVPNDDTYLAVQAVCYQGGDHGFGCFQMSGENFTMSAMCGPFEVLFNNRQTPPAKKKKQPESKFT